MLFSYISKQRWLVATSPIRISTCVPRVRMRPMRSRLPALPAPPHPLMRVAAATSASPRRPGCTRLYFPHWDLACAALQQVQVLLEVAIQHHYDIMPAQHFEHRFQRLHGPSQETKLKLQLLLASLRSKCAATPEGAAGAAISIPRGMSARGIN